MAKLDSKKEEMGWLKVLFAILAASDASLVAWIFQTYGNADAPLFLCAAAVATGTTVCLL